MSWAIENVIKNGLDSLSSNEGTVDVKISSDAKGIQIFIQDDGKGILRRNWKKVFQPGFTTKKFGWGFGLSLSYRIIKEFSNHRRDFICHSCRKQYVLMLFWKYI